MNNVIEFIRKNIIIVLIVVITWLLVIAWYIYAYNNIIERFSKDNILSTVSETKKHIYLKYNDKEDGALYFSLSSRKDCNIDDQYFDCHDHLAILHKEKDDFSKFVINKIPANDSPKYRLLLANYDLIISQNLNYVKTLPKYGYGDSNIPLCAYSPSLEHTAFHIIEGDDKNNKGRIKLVFYKDVTIGGRETHRKYYVGICGPEVCTNSGENCQPLSCIHHETTNGKVSGTPPEHFKRLCLTTKESDGIFFDIELVEDK